MDSLVSAEWLAGEMGACDLRIVDATKHLPEAGRDARAEYAEGHIPGAVFMNLEELVDPAAPIENTLPPAERFASRMQALGLGDGSRIVLYDDSAVKTAARAWFMLRMFGANHVAILDGGLAAWIASGQPLESGTITRRAQEQRWPVVMKLDCTTMDAASSTSPSQTTSGLFPPISSATSLSGRVASLRLIEMPVLG